MGGDAKLSGVPLSFPLSARLGWFYFSYFAYTAALVAYFPLYLAARGLDAGEIAFVLALPQVARIVAPSGWGWLADRTGAQRAIVAFSCAIAAACFFALPRATGVAGMAWMIAVMSMLSAGALPLVEAIALASLSDQPGRYGPIRLWGSVGFIAIVLSGGAWLDYRPIETLPMVLGALALGSLASSAFLPATALRHHERPHQRIPNTSAVRALLAAGFCMAAAHGALYAFLTLHLQALGYSAVAIGVLWTLGVLAEIVVFAYLPALFRRYSLSAILAGSLGLGVARFLAIAWFADVVWILVSAQLLHAATFGSFHAAAVAAVHRIFPPEAHARGQTLFSSLSYGAGGAAGALLAGWGWQAGGPGIAFSAGAVAAFVGAYFAYRLKRAGV
jgi:PPP family 3-phenylpropionic acid transporter